MSIESVENGIEKWFLESSLLKGKSFLKHIWAWEGFLDSLNNAGITPNNVVTFRIALMVSGAVAYLLQKDVWAVTMTVSCILDATDGKLARQYNKKSKEGEIYDPLSDKISETLLSFLSFSNLGNLQSTTQLPLTLARLYYHYQSQFNEKRGDVSTQLAIISDLLKNGDKNISYINKTTNWAASSAGKWKTTLQFTSGLWIVWLYTDVAQEVLSLFLRLWIPISLHEITQFLTWIFIWVWWASLPLAMKSAKGKKKP